MPRPTHRCRRAFSLIEAAIVLAIIGLVIGGIWVAASSVTRKQRINEIRQIFLLVHKEAASLKATLTGGSFNLVTLMVLKTLPGNYTQNSYLLTNGRQWLTAFLYGSDPPYLGGYVVFNAGSPIGTSPQNPDPQLCLEVSQMLIKANLGVPSNGNHSLVWHSTTWTGATIATWDYGSAPPSMSTLTGYCSSAISVQYFWYI